MISPIQAIERCESAYDSRKVTCIFDYDDSKYLIAAPLKNVKKDYNGCFFTVNKNTGHISVFSPGEDFDKFFDIINNGAIKI